MNILAHDYFYWFMRTELGFFFWPIRFMPILTNNQAYFTHPLIFPSVHCDYLLINVFLKKRIFLIVSLSLSEKIIYIGAYTTLFIFSCDVYTITQYIMSHLYCLPLPRQSFSSEELSFLFAILLSNELVYYCKIIQNYKNINCKVPFCNPASCMNLQRQSADCNPIEDLAEVNCCLRLKLRRQKCFHKPSINKNIPLYSLDHFPKFVTAPIFFLHHHVFNETKIDAILNKTNNRGCLKTSKKLTDTKTLFGVIRQIGTKFQHDETRMLKCSFKCLNEMLIDVMKERN